MSDRALTPDNVVPTASAVIERGIAYHQINAGDLLYIDAANSNKLRNASNTDASTAELVGIALNSAEANQPIAYATSGDVNVLANEVVAGTVYVLGASAGNISPAGDLDSTSNTRYCSVIGVGINSTTLRVHIINSGVLNP